jgi:hypothetical protein
MGACFSQNSSADSPEARQSKTLDKKLRDDEKRMTKEVKLLLLGKWLKGGLCKGQYTDLALLQALGTVESRPS